MKSIGIFQVSDKTYEYLLAHAAEKGIELEDFVAEIVEAAVRAASDNQK